jgi:hypothetical protein
LTGISLCSVCSCHEILRAQRTRGQSCLHKDLSRLHETTTEKTDLSEFMELLRSGAPIPNQMIYDFAKLFRDEFLLDNLPRSQLVAMCKFLHIDGPYMKVGLNDAPCPPFTSHGASIMLAQRPHRPHPMHFIIIIRTAAATEIPLPGCPFHHRVCS